MLQAAYSAYSLHWAETRGRTCCLTFRKSSTLSVRHLKMTYSLCGSRGQSHEWRGGSGCSGSLTAAWPRLTCSWAASLPHSPAGSGSAAWAGSPSCPSPTAVMQQQRVRGQARSKSGCEALTGLRQGSSGVLTHLQVSKPIVCEIEEGQARNGGCRHRMVRV